jgi:hypothetical protein
MLPLPNSGKSIPKKIKKSLWNKFDPLMTPRVGFHEERANKKTPSTTSTEFVRAQGLAGIHPARISAERPCTLLRERALEDGPTIH